MGFRVGCVTRNWSVDDTIAPPPVRSVEMAKTGKNLNDECVVVLRGCHFATVSSRR